MKEQSQRQLRVAQQIRQELARLLLRGEFIHPGLPNPAIITVTEVSMSPDLKNARAFVVQLGDASIGKDALTALNELAPHIQGMMARSLNLRSTPRLRFEEDTSFQTANRLNDILAGIKTAE